MQDHFAKLKTNLELSKTLQSTIQTRHNAVRSYLKEHHTDFQDSKLIGSLQRLTRIHPLPGGDFDIDILVVMGEFYGWQPSGLLGVTPGAALRSLHRTVHGSGRYGAMDPGTDPPTVTLTAKDNVTVELVPAYIDMIGTDPAGKYLGTPGRGYWIPKDNQWKMADYDHEAEYISSQNQISGGYLIPTIKMLKAIRRGYFEEFETFGSIPNDGMTKQSLLDECKIVLQNCTYSAEAHHQVALRAKRKTLWLEVVPAVGAALSSGLAVSGKGGAIVSTEILLLITLVSASVSAVASILNPNREHDEHLGAGKKFTALKHDSRYLKDVKSTVLSDDAFAEAVQNLHDRYNELIKSVPPTDAKAFAKAREVIQRGIHEPDRDQAGELK